MLSRENFTDVVLPNHGGFYPDDRPVTEYPLFTVTPCMADCSAPVQITRRACDLDVMPTDPDGRPCARAHRCGGCRSPRSRPAPRPPRGRRPRCNPARAAKGFILPDMPPRAQAGLPPRPPRPPRPQQAGRQRR